MEWETRISQITVLPKGKTILDEGATHIRIEDEGGGEFVIIEQLIEDKGNELRFDDNEWPLIKDAVDKMFKGLKKV